MTATDLDTICRKVTRGCRDQVKRRALLAALRSPELVRARLTTHGILLEGPGGIVSTHLSGGDGRASVAPLLRDLRKVGLA